MAAEAEQRAGLRRETARCAGAVVSCTALTPVSERFVADLLALCPRVFATDPGFAEAAAAQLGPDVLPLAALDGAAAPDLPLLWFLPGDEWCDPVLATMLEDARARGARSYLNRFQYGLTPLITADIGLGRRFLAHRNPIGLLTHMSKNRADTVVSYDEFGRESYYLRLDQPDGKAALTRMIESGGGQETLDPARHPTTFAVLNREFIAGQIARIDVFAPLEGRRVLEIAASHSNPVVGRLMTERYGCDYVGLNIVPFDYAAGPGIELIQADLHAIDLAPESFDLVFSIAAWEHIRDPLTAFDRIAGWLRPGGVHYGLFQSWNSAVGHHIFSPWYPAHLVPDWGHLALDPEAMRSHLHAGGAAPELAGKIVHDIYRSDDINRVPNRDFVAHILAGPLETLYLDGRARGRINPRAAAMAETLPDWSAEELSCLGLEFALRKSDFDIRAWPLSLTPGDPNAE